MKQRIYLSPPHISQYEREFVADAFESNWIAPLGPHVDAFEREIAGYAGVNASLALNSGTSAIHLALRYLEAGPGDLVFCSSLTFVASANPVLYQGAQPVFIDSEPRSWNMSPEALKRAFAEAEKIGRMPKAVILVDLYGQSADMAPLLEICRHNRVPVIEDAAEALGASYQGKMSGGFGLFGAYSFNGNKIITTSGGGMLVSDDREALDKCRFWATQAKDPAPHYQHSDIGYNYRLSNILAAIGRGQLQVLNDRVRACRQVFSRYVEALSEIDGLDFMPEIPDGRSSRWLTVITLDPARCRATPAQLMEAFEAENIESRPVWKPLHLQPLFDGSSYYPHQKQTSVSEKLFARGLCLPSGSNLREEEQERVINCLKATLKQ